MSYACEEIRCPRCGKADQQDVVQDHFYSANKRFQSKSYSVDFICGDCGKEFELTWETKEPRPSETTWDEMYNPYRSNGPYVGIYP